MGWVYRGIRGVGGVKENGMGQGVTVICSGCFMVESAGG